MYTISRVHVSDDEIKYSQHMLDVPKVDCILTFFKNHIAQYF